MDNRYLRQLYLEDLGKQVTYDGKKYQQRVRQLQKWSDIQSTVHNHNEEFRTLNSTDNIWVWSDQHFGHKNIIKFCDRPWDDVEKMTEDMIANFCQLVGPNDVSIWVGDVCFKSSQNINKLLDTCPGYKILVVGNHDFNKKQLRKLHFDEIHLMYHLQKDDIDYVFTHYPMSNLPKPLINVHGHVHNNVHEAPHEQQINVSVEVIDYVPINMAELHITGKTRVASMENL